MLIGSIGSSFSMQAIQPVALQQAQDTVVTPTAVTQTGRDETSSDDSRSGSEEKRAATERTSIGAHVADTPASLAILLTVQELSGSTSSDTGAGLSAVYAGH